MPDELLLVLEKVEKEQKAAQPAPSSRSVFLLQADTSTIYSSI